MPLYSNVEHFSVGLHKAASLLPIVTDYQYTKPVVYYGSSITQGGCASRPGNSYPSILSRACNCDYVNLGFSGSARGEQAMAEYIANLEMSAFVFDYDHNAPSVEYLAQTHEAFFETIRRKQPQIPVIMISQPKYCCDEDTEKRREIILNTYRNAKKRGDKKVSFLDGSMFFSELYEDCVTVDNCHPNDLGFFYMAKKIKPRLAEVLNSQFGDRRIRD